MTPDPESPEVVGARARERVAAATPRRSVVRSISVVAPTIRAEQTPAMPHVPERYAPVSLAVSPSVTWEQTQADEAAAEPWGAIGERLATSPVTAGPAWSAMGRGGPGFDADDYISGAR